MYIVKLIEKCDFLFHIQHYCHYDLRKFNFTNRVFPIWNSSSNHVVSADTINTLKIV